MKKNSVPVPSVPVSPLVRLYTIEEVERLLQISRPTVNRWIKTGKLRITKIGRGVRIPEASLIALINAGSQTPVC